jgi:uncharacterized membrane-anchored protein
MQQSKPWYLSKLIWLGVLSMATAGLTASLEVDSNWQTIALAVIGAAIVGLRATTEKKLTR